MLLTAAGNRAAVEDILTEADIRNPIEKPYFIIPRDDHRDMNTFNRNNPIKSKTLYPLFRVNK